MGARETLAKLRAETKSPDVEELQHAAREEERREEYFTGLLNERVGVAAELLRVERTKPDEKVEIAWLPPQMWGMA